MQSKEFKPQYDPERKTFSEALRNSDFNLLDDETKSYFLSRYVAADRRMVELGQADVVWDGNIPIEKLINNEVVAKTERGEVVGKAITFGKIDDGGVVKRTVLVHVPSSGSVYEVFGRNVRLAEAEDLTRMRTEITMAQRLVVANRNVEEMVKAKRSKRVNGSHLVDRMMSVVKQRKLAVDDKAGYHKIFGNEKGVCVYLAKKGGRADLSGFCVEHPAVIPLSEEEAKAKHLGKVRGQVDFNRPDELVMEAWDVVLGRLG